jgi:lipopolysaccharide biosynthesis protein
MDSTSIEDRQKIIDDKLNSSSLTKLIAFYLPQYHPIPENDEWWGKGFTEWTNVAKANPLFPGHYQPHLPADLGFYDLRVPEVRAAQAKLAQEYGIHGFCYYHYWFNGRMILERPFNEVLASGSPDFPFCLAWANENWSRRWNGSDKEVLLKQDYTTYDPIEHIAWLEQAFQDPRYIRIDGKPLFLVYKAAEIPEIAQIIQSWRNYIQSKGYPDLYICFMRAGHDRDGTSNIPELFAQGFDAHVDFQGGVFSDNSNLHKSLVQKIAMRLDSPLLFFSAIIGANIFNYSKMVEKATKQKQSAFKTFPCVFPSWDNSSRRKRNQDINQNNDENLYRQWLLHAIGMVQNYESDRKIVFINAWNEWAEGCHLEPDRRNGKKFLEATKAALDSVSPAAKFNTAVCKHLGDTSNIEPNL